MLGCATNRHRGTSVASTSRQPSTDPQREIDPQHSTEKPSPHVQLVAYEEVPAQQPPLSASRATDKQPLGDDAPTTSELLQLPAAELSADGLTLDLLQEMALGHSPAVQQMAARLDALQGKWLQVGLRSNPTVGYVASEIGQEGTAGQQGAYVGQTLITAGKLQCRRDVVAAEIARTQQELAIVRQRVLTDVSKGYYAALLAQRRVETAADLLVFTEEASLASKELYEAEEIPLSGVLQSELLQQQTRVTLRSAQNQHRHAWRSLLAVVGNVHLTEQTLTGNVRQLPQQLEWSQQVARVQSLSPEIAVAMAEIARRQSIVCRECANAIPNITTQVSVQYDDSTDYTVTGVQIGMPLPIWDRNQGSIREAQSQVAAARRNVERVERSLKQRLAAIYRDYADASFAVETYAAEILPRAEETRELVHKGYTEGEVGYLDALLAQRTYAQTNLAYFDALSRLWQSYWQIDGLLLDQGLNAAP